MGLGEVPMAPRLGTTMHTQIFKTIGPVTMAVISQEIRDLISTHVPGMQVLSVIPTLEDNGGSLVGQRIVVNVSYTVVGEAGEFTIPIDSGA
jgi:phage baseplate assembly protein W